MKLSRSEKQRQSKDRQAARKTCPDCGSDMRASKVKKTWYAICKNDPFHAKFILNGFPGKKPDAMNYRLSGNFEGGKK